jgi:hypothetical protein
MPISEQPRIPELPDLALKECDEVERIASEGSSKDEEEEAIQLRISDQGHVQDI